MDNKWRTFQGNLARTGESKEVVVPPLRKLWEYKLVDEVATSSPIIYNNTVYIGTSSLDKPSGKFYALDANSGKVLWEFVLGSKILSTATVGVDTVYLRAENNVLYALSTTTGEIKWEIKHDASSKTRTNLLLARNLLCMSTDKLYLIDITTGEIVLEENNEGENSGTSPALYEGVLYYGAGHKIIAYDLNSRKEIWQRQLSSLLNLIAGPVIKNDVIYVSLEMHLMCLNIANGGEIWVKRISDDLSYPSISKDRVFIGASGRRNIYSLDAKTGDGIWGFDMEAYPASSPVVSGDVVYILSSAGIFYALNASNGVKRWEYASPIGDNNIVRSLINSSAAICDGKIFIAWDKVYAFSK